MIENKTIIIAGFSALVGFVLGFVITWRVVYGIMNREINRIVQGLATLAGGKEWKDCVAHPKLYSKNKSVQGVIIFSRELPKPKRYVRTVTKQNGRIGEVKNQKEARMKVNIPFLLESFAFMLELFLFIGTGVYYQSGRFFLAFQFFMLGLATAWGVGQLIIYNYKKKHEREF